MKTARCSTCSAEIIWAQTAASGRLMPVNATPSPEGNVRLEPAADPREPPIAHMKRRDWPGPAGVVRYQAHFVSCPQADEHRRTP